LKSTEHFDDPVAAYGRLAPHYADLSRRRELYLRSIERIIASRVSPLSKSLLDIGAGDGARALHIARVSGIERVVLLEPSPEMSAKAPGTAEVWQIRAEDLPGVLPNSHLGTRPDLERFDVITCLWNVLGHIPTTKSRVQALYAIAERLSVRGRCFLDVNHRHNVRSYGILPTAARFVRDCFSYKEENADVIAKWDAGECRISTYGHVFTTGEVRQLLDAAGLLIDERLVVDYDSGEIRHFSFLGNLLYVLRRSSRTDSSSAPQTS
jgi:SAM-dependent methyltransferase